MEHDGPSTNSHTASPSAAETSSLREELRSLRSSLAQREATLLRREGENFLVTAQLQHFKRRSGKHPQEAQLLADQLAQALSCIDTARSAKAERARATVLGVQRSLQRLARDRVVESAPSSSKPSVPTQPFSDRRRLCSDKLPPPSASGNSANQSTASSLNGTTTAASTAEGAENIPHTPNRTRPPRTGGVSRSARLSMARREPATTVTRPTRELAPSENTCEARERSLGLRRERRAGKTCQGAASQQREASTSQVSHVGEPAAEPAAEPPARAEPASEPELVVSIAPATTGAFGTEELSKALDELEVERSRRRGAEADAKSSTEALDIEVERSEALRLQCENALDEVQKLSVEVAELRTTQAAEVERLRCQVNDLWAERGDFAGGLETRASPNSIDATSRISPGITLIEDTRENTMCSLEIAGPSMFKNRAVFGYNHFRNGTDTASHVACCNSTGEIAAEMQHSNQDSCATGGVAFSMNLPPEVSSANRSVIDYCWRQRELLTRLLRRSITLEEESSKLQDDVIRRNSIIHSLRVDKDIAIQKSTEYEQQILQWQHWQQQLQLQEEEHIAMVAASAQLA